MKATDISKKLFFKVVRFGVALCVLLAFVLLAGGCEAEKKEYVKDDYINYISFSPDGRKILFDRSKDKETRRLHVYDLEKKELSAYQPPDNEMWSMARYSYDGKKIVFTITPIVDEYLKLDDIQIAVMDPNGKNLRKITNSKGVKIFPSFSHDRKKIIYARAGRIRESGKTPASKYDIYEIDVTSGNESRLTRFEFYQVNSPYYYPDDKTFIFSADDPGQYRGVSNDVKAMQKKNNELKLLYKENTIYVMRGGEETLTPYIMFQDYSDSPLLSADGSRLLFRSRETISQKGFWYRYYLYSPDGKHKSIANNPEELMVNSADVSPDGALLGVVYDMTWRGITFGVPPWNCKIVIYQIKNGTRQDILLPDKPSRIINQP